MYATACNSTNNEKNDIALMIICGFMGSLKGWWDNYLVAVQRTEILRDFKLERNESGQEVRKSDIIYTLIQVTVYHFIGVVTNNDESQIYLFQNLKCVSLAHFR